MKIPPRMSEGFISGCPVLGLRLGGRNTSQYVHAAERVMQPRKHAKASRRETFPGLSKNPFGLLSARPKPVSLINRRSPSVAAFQARTSPSREWYSYGVSVRSMEFAEWRLKLKLAVQFRVSPASSQTLPKLVLKAYRQPTLCPLVGRGSAAFNLECSAVRERDRFGLKANEWQSSDKARLQRLQF
ncbi:uncharacterized protein UDID_18117 [Ustilago sp. UG-2017a]|nr:uncharacterized protein UDID_18117 [Ustilago sp. UG-2017a]